MSVTEMYYTTLYHNYGGIPYDIIAELHTYNMKICCGPSAILNYMRYAWVSMSGYSQSLSGSLLYHLTGLTSLLPAHVSNDN